jgi:hypothetical protein
LWIHLAIPSFAFTALWNANSSVTTTIDRSTALLLNECA